MKFNPILCADFYKVSHPEQYPQGTEYIYSNFTPRSSKLANKLSEVFDDKIVFFGLQGFIKEFLIDNFNTNFFQKSKEDVVKAYKKRCDSSLGEGSVSTERIEALHDLGYLPLKIKALPEGSLVNMQVPVLTVVNTIPEFFWLTNFIETMMSAELWKACTSATTALQYKRLLTKAAEQTGSPVEFVSWQGHDFSMRGMSGVHDAAVSSAGHLLSFLGTDTIPAIEYLEHYYGASDTFVGGSVPASEHSVMCAGGMDNERDTFKRLITEIYPTGVVSVVSDTWDFWNVMTNITPSLKEEILSRKPNTLGLAKVVFRPDSGDPADILCGSVKLSYKSLDEATISINDMHWTEAKNDCEGSYNCGLEKYSTLASVNGKVYEFSTCFKYDRHGKEYYYIDNYSKGCGGTTHNPVEATPEMIGAVECLWNTFGGTTTDKGYKVLNERVGLIYGDSITLERAKDILERLEAKGFASCNVVFGIGSYTYQYATRDSFGFAMKATHSVVNGEGHNLFKDPATDSGVKKSAKGLLRVVKDDNGNFVLYDKQTVEQEVMGELKEVFVDGKLVVDQNLDEIRKRLN